MSLVISSIDTSQMAIDKPVIVVVHATSKQGTSVVNSLLQTDKFAVKAITRNAGSDSAIADMLSPAAHEPSPCSRQPRMHAISPRIAHVVPGLTGNPATPDELAELVKTEPVSCICRGAEAKRLAAKGAQVVEADALDAASLRAAFEGAYGVFAMTPLHGGGGFEDGYRLELEQGADHK